MQRIEEEQLKIFYFFMLADGKCTGEELDNFEKIYKAMEIKNEDVKDIIRDCELAVDISNSDNSERIKKAIQVLLEDKEKNDFFPVNSLKNNKKQQIYVIWNLINLGYADREYSDPEKKIVSFLSDYWKIDNALLSEMLDTAETMLSLVRHIDWLKTMDKPYDEIHESIEKAESDIENLKQNIEKTLEIAGREV